MLDAYMQSHSLNMHAQLSSGAREMVFGLCLHQGLFFKLASSEGSGETSPMCMPVLTFAAHIQ